MPSKPVVLMEGWQLLRLNDQPHQLWGFVTNHPNLPGFRRCISTSRVLKIDDQQREAETLNTRYRLHRPIERVSFNGACPVRFHLTDLVSERDELTHSWHVCRDAVVLADGLVSMSAAALVMLTILDREGINGLPC